MLINNLKKKSLVYHIIILVSILFSCTSNTEKNPVYEKSEQTSEVPGLVQQEIGAEGSSLLEEYSLYHSVSNNKGPVIPGIFQAAVPQGMAYYSDENLMFISNYMFDGRPSCITIVNMGNGLLQKTLWLLNPDGTAHMGHVGGLAVSKKNLWIASGKGAYNIPLENIKSADDNSSVKMMKLYSTEAKGSFSSFSDNVLWVGEFTSRDGSYSVSKSHYFKTTTNNINHAWMAGYLLDSESDLINNVNEIDGLYYPDFILSIPDETQGASFMRGKIILSRSYGRKNNSRLAIYTDTRKESPDAEYVTKDNRSIPVWILDNHNFKLEIPAPPMTEGLTDFKGLLAVLFESGSDKYRATAKNPQDRIGMVNINF